MANLAELESKITWLKYDFGNELARKWFGDEAIDALPKFTRGKNKGKTKGCLTWNKCTKGGWAHGGVARPGHCYSHSIREDASSTHEWLDFNATLVRKAERAARERAYEARVA